MQFWKKSDKESKRLECFRTIDELPIKVWFDVHKTGDYRLLIKGEIPEVDAKQFHELFEAWEEIYNQYIEIFGLSEEFLEDLNNQIELANYRAEFIISGDRYFRTLIKVHEERMSHDKKGNEKEIELEILLAKMSKYYGFKLESKELTVVQYYSYLETVKNG